jgi:hypothetical protein
MYRHILFRPTDDAAGGAAGAATPTAGDPPSPPADQKASGAADDKQASPPPAKVEFSAEQQAQIDALVAERVKRAEKAAEKKAAQQAEEAARRAQMDESERLKAEKADAEKRAEEAEKRAERTLVAAEAKLAVLSAGAKAERIERILGLLELDEVVVTDGVPDSEAIKSAVHALKGELPELFVAAPVPGRSGADMGGPAKPTWSRAQIAELARDPKAYAEHEAEIDAALAEGRITD